MVLLSHGITIQRFVILNQYQIVTIIFLVPFLAVGTRRLNDAGQSVWWRLFLFVPFGQIIVLFYMAEKSKHIDDR